MNFIGWKMNALVVRKDFTVGDYCHIGDVENWTTYAVVRIKNNWFFGSYEERREDGLLSSNFYILEKLKRGEERRRVRELGDCFYYKEVVNIF